jgi:hypothetical protein
MTYNCEFCKKNFSTKSSLKTHQKSAKYCLKIQNKPIKDKFKCDGCGKKFTTLLHINRHMEICKTIEVTLNLREKVKILENNIFELQDYKSKYLTLLEENIEQKDQYERKIKELQDKLENIALKAVSRPVSTTKNTQINYIQNLQPVTEEHLENNVSNLTIDHIKKGVEGYAEYALEYPLKDRLLCSDYSRRKIKFKDKDGKVITDPEMTTLAKKFFNSIKDKNKELICECANKLKERLGDDNVMDTVVKIFEYKEAVNRSSEGEKTDFHHDFVRQVCSQTLRE